VRLATHQGFLSNREGGQLENVVVSVGLNGEGVAQGHGGGHTPRSGSSAGRLVRCGGRSARACIDGYGGEETTSARGLKQVQNHTMGGVCCARRHAEAGGAQGSASRSCTGVAETDAGRVTSGAVREGEQTAHVGCTQAPGPRVSAWAGREGKGGSSPEKQ
jgi:hypothetical protein